VLDRTRDHSLVQGLVDTGVLTPDQMRTHPKRSELRSALGIAADLLEVSAGDGSDDVQAGDVFLLCTDGLWEYLDEVMLERTLASAPNPGAWIGELGEQVRRAASHKTSHDNFSALTVWTRAVSEF
ncbi:MAG: serine/threonine-protein phosphatase, partial [Rubrivivax sp.]|nr:serine/threonine-protein phosphatase [Rubrivivax sp.]